MKNENNLSVYANKLINTIQLYLFHFGLYSYQNYLLSISYLYRKLLPVYVMNWIKGLVQNDRPIIQFKRVEYSNSTMLEDISYQLILPI